MPLAGGTPTRLPAPYVTEHVGLAYALTIHKAQGTTADKALVVTDGHDHDDHVRPVGISGIEQLVQVLRRDGTEHSAHEVLRAGLARAEGRELLRGMADVLRERLDERAGPDRRREIAELGQRDEDDLLGARHDEQRALRGVEEGRHRLDRAERRHEALLELRGLWCQSDDQPTPADRDERSRAPRHLDVGVGVNEDPRLRRPVPDPARRGPGIGR